LCSIPFDTRSFDPGYRSRSGLQVGLRRADGRDRTGDLRFTRAALCQLSYVGVGCIVPSDGYIGGPRADYWGEPIVTPEWYRPFIDVLNMPGDSLWPDAEHLGYYLSVRERAPFA
jgi:hypothetical protein